MAKATPGLKAHALADLLPMMDDAAYAELLDDVRRHGVHEPIVLLGGRILDGRNRYRAAVEAGVPCPAELFAGDDPLAYVVSLNLKRRHLSESQRAMVATRIASLQRGRKSNTATAAFTQADAAAMLKVSADSIQRARRVRDRGVLALIAAVEAGRVKVSTAADVASLSPEEQAAVVALGETGILAKAKAIRIERAARAKEDRARVRARRPVLPGGRYETLVVDPPWPSDERFIGYPTMSEAELEAFGATLGGMMAPDCHCFIWTTSTFLPLTLRLLETWGLRYSLTMVWHKARGSQPFRLPMFNCEFVVYARAGSPQFTSTKAFLTCFEGRRREHSRKPDEFYDTIRRVTAGPRVDVFSREKREGFDQYGIEVDTFASAAVG